jgi:hypothetical protein
MAVLCRPVLGATPQLSKDLPRNDDSGTVITFDVLGAGTGFFQGTFANGINPSGAITGYYVDTNYNAHVNDTSNLRRKVLKVELLPDGRLHRISDDRYYIGTGCPAVATVYYPKNRLGSLNRS